MTKWDDEFKDFDKEFDAHARRITKFTKWVIIFNIFLTIISFAGIGWVLYVLLKHFEVIS